LLTLERPYIKRWRPGGRRTIYKEVEAGWRRGGMPGGGRWWDPRLYYLMAVERQPGSMKPGGDG